MASGNAHLVPFDPAAEEAEMFDADAFNAFLNLQLQQFGFDAPSFQIGNAANGNGQCCAACLNHMLGNHAVIKTNCCKQQMHCVCIRQWTAKRETCPLCRADLS